MELVKEYRFKNFPNRIIVGKGGRKKYYFNDKTLPKYLGSKMNTEYEFENYTVQRSGKKVIKERLVSIDTGEPVIKSVGKPKYLKIAGQKLHELTLQPWQRSKILQVLKAYFINNMKEQGIIKTKQTNIFIHLIFAVDKKHISKSQKLDTLSSDIKDSDVGDLDSLELFYKKTLFDCFQTYLQKFGNIEPTFNEVGFIENDNAIILNDYRVSYIHREGRRDLIVRIYNKNKK